MNDAIKILIVDDNVETRGLYADVFRAQRFDVREANDGLEALDMVSQIVPDVILSGIIMPRMDGFQLVEALKKNVTSSGIPVVFLSHLGREEDERRARELGVRDFFVQGIVSPIEATKRVKGLFEESDFLINIDPTSLDAGRLAGACSIPESFQDGNGGKWVLRLKLRNPEKKQFDAELTTV